MVQLQAVSMPRRHLPQIDDANRTFWTGGATGRLLFTRCIACGLYIHPHAPICRRCRSTDLRTEAVSGKASVAAFTINRHVWEAGLEEPFVIALVDLVEQQGLRLTTNIVNCPIESVHIGMPVEVIFERAEDVWLPLFQPAEKAA